MAKTKIICDGINRTCFHCRRSLPVECFHIRSSVKNNVIQRNGRCKICVSEKSIINYAYLNSFHKNAKLALDSLVYQEIVSKQIL